MLVHLSAEPIVCGRGLVGVEDERVALRNINREAVNIDRLDEGSICFDYLDGVVVYWNLEFTKGAGVDDAKAISFILGYGDNYSSWVVLTGISTIVIVRGAIKAVEINNGTRNSEICLLLVCSLN